MSDDGTIRAISPQVGTPLPPNVAIPKNAENVNTNTITLHLPIPASAAGVRSELSGISQPFKVEVDTPTDWPSVTATLLVGVAVAYFAWVSQRSQIRSSTAGYRHTWLQALRDAVLKFIAATSEINYKLKADPQFSAKPESDEIFRQLVTAQGAIHLMLDKKKRYTVEIEQAMLEVRNAIRAVDEDRIERAVVQFTNKAQEVLELAWQDMRRDLQQTSRLSI